MRIPFIASLSFSHREDLRIRSGRGRGRARGHRCAWGRRPTHLFRPIDPARLIADANGPAGGVVRRLGKEAGALPASALRPSSSSHSSTNPDEKGSVYRSDIVKILLNAAGAGRRGGARGARLRRHRPLEFGENVLAGPAGSGAPHGPAPRARGDESSGESHGRRAGGLAEPRPVWPGISARGPGRGDRRCPRRRHRTDAPCRSSWIRIRPPPVVLPDRPRRARPIPRGPTHRGGGRAAAREGLDGVIPLTATATTGMTLVSSGAVPPPSSGAGRGRLSGADPAQRPRGRAGGPRSRPPRRRVRQPGSLVMSLLVCCRLVM